MYDEKKIKDSLDFVDQIRLFKNFDPEHISDRYQSSDVVLPREDDYYEDMLDFDEPEEEEAEDEDNSDESNENDENAELRSGIISDIVFILTCMVISVIVAFAFTRLIAHHTIVDGNSMRNTLEDSDCLIIEKVSYYFHSPERYDIVVFPFSDDVNYIKRIIGLPGETVQIKDGYVYINDVRLSDDIYGSEIIANPGIAESPIKIGEDEYFVLGDNRNSSYDSRKPDVGLVKGDNIEGKAVFRIWPVDEWGTVE